MQVSAALVALARSRRWSGAARPRLRGSEAEAGPARRPAAPPPPARRAAAGNVLSPSPAATGGNAQMLLRRRRSCGAGRGQAQALWTMRMAG